MENEVFNIKNEQEFNKIALNIFNFQYINNIVYQKYCNLLKIDPKKITFIEEIPFLPIEFFKKLKIVSSNDYVQKIFRSSGTTSNIVSKHYITDLKWYKKSFIKGFNHFYGKIENYIILGLLPNYLEKKGSSLVYMVDNLIKLTKNKESGFYLNNLKELSQKLNYLNKKNKKIILIGTTYALVNLVEKNNFILKNTIIIETGGMKGTRKEIIREELHKILTKGFGVKKIHSEYGMTELLSQAYSLNNGIFKCPPWMKILIREIDNPLHIKNKTKSGGINIIDLANYNSCSFIATQDLGKISTKNDFEVIGRLDNTDIRGCNLLTI